MFIILIYKSLQDDMKSKRSAIELVKYYRIMGHAYLARTDQRFVEVLDKKKPFLFYFRRGQC